MLENCGLVIPSEKTKLERKIKKFKSVKQDAPVHNLSKESNSRIKEAADKISNAYNDLEKLVLDNQEEIQKEIKNLEKREKEY